MFLLVHHKGNHWALPKGHPKEGEINLVTAKRELYEETGIKECEILNAPLIEEKYSFELKGKIHNKTNYFFIGVVNNLKTKTPEKFKHEIEKIKWLPYSEAMKLATFDTARDALKQVFKIFNDINRKY